MILDHHDGYIGWADFERNQRLISDNANGKSFISRGSIRRGEALLAGLLRCGHCGRKLHVAYSGANGSAGRYHCRGGHLNHGGDRCISFGGMRIDRAIGAEVIERLQPLGIQAALARDEAGEPMTRRSGGRLNWLSSRRGSRRLVRIGNTMRSIPTTVLLRPVLSNAGMIVCFQCGRSKTSARAGCGPSAALTEAERARLLALGADVEQAWSSPAPHRRRASGSSAP